MRLGGAREFHAVGDPLDVLRGVSDLRTPFASVDGDRRLLALRALSDLGPECAFVKLLALLLHAALFHGLGNVFLRFLRARESVMKWAYKGSKAHAP